MGQKQNKETKQCPQCKESAGIVPMIYGFPSQELFNRAEKG